jgi:hypothetical protein
VSKLLTPEERRKVGRMMSERKREIRRYRRNFPRWHAGMSIKDYIWFYQCSNREVPTFVVDDIYFLKKEG